MVMDEHENKDPVKNIDSSESIKINSFESGNSPTETKLDLEPKEFIDFPSLFTILSAHHIDEENKLRFGIEETKLLEVLGVKKARLKYILEQFEEEINKLGLEIVKYRDDNKTWIAIRHRHFAPLNLSKQAEVLLGFSFGHFMELPKPEFKVEDFRLELTVRGFMTNAEYTNSLDELVKKRYLRRSRGVIRLGVRSLLEFDEDARIKIGKQALRLLRGKDWEYEPKEINHEKDSSE